MQFPSGTPIHTSSGYVVISGMRIAERACVYTAVCGAIGRVRQDLCVPESDNGAGSQGRQGHA